MNSNKNNKTTDEHDDSDLFDGPDFVFTQDPTDGNIMGGGYKIKSFFLQGGISPMVTYNTPSEQLGGKVSSPFENLAVPAGLFYINMRAPNKNTSNQHYKSHEMASDEMIDKLYELVEVDKKRKRKTRKDHRPNKTKTRKHK